MGGLNTRFCGCISMATLTPFSRASASISVQNGTATRPTGSPASRGGRSPRCSRATPATARRDAPCGRPDMVTTRSTPSSPATRIELAQILGVFGTDLRVGMQRVAVAVQAGDGDPGALEDAPGTRAGVTSPESRSSTGRCSGGRNPPALISMPVRPSEAMTSRASRQRTVVQDRVIDAELHEAVPSSCGVGIRRP